MKNLPGIIILLASCSAFLPAKQTIRVASTDAVEETSLALPGMTATPNTTAGEPPAVPDDTVPTPKPAVVSSQHNPHPFQGSVDAGNQCVVCWEVKNNPIHTTSGAGETGAGDSYSKSGLTSPLEFENETLRKERDELLAAVADLQAQVKRLTSYTVQPVPARSVPQQPVYYQTYGSCGPGGCGVGRGPIRRLFGRR